MVGEGDAFGPRRDAGLRDAAGARTARVSLYPEIDERAAAAMCYTSGTTGNPKGVAYSHRSTYLHSFGISSAQAMGFSQEDRCC